MKYSVAINLRGRFCLMASFYDIEDAKLYRDSKEKIHGRENVMIIEL